MTEALERLFKPTPPSNPEVLGVLIAALEIANATKTTPADPHLVEVLLRIGSVAHSLAAVGVDLARAREGVRRVIAKLPRRPGALTRTRDMLRNTRAALDPLYRVREKAMAAGLAEVDGPFALVTIVADTPNRELEGALKDAGFSLLAYRWYVAHHGAIDGACPLEGPVRIAFYNDPFTPMELVVSLLTQVFDRDEETARTLMLRTHEDGLAVLATMDAPVAARRLAEARSRAKKLDFPLRITAERAA